MVEHSFAIFLYNFYKFCNLRELPVENGIEPCELEVFAVIFAEVEKKFVSEVIAVFYVLHFRRANFKLGFNLASQLAVNQSGRVFQIPLQVEQRVVAGLDGIFYELLAKLLRQINLVLLQLVRRLPEIAQMILLLEIANHAVEPSPQISNFSHTLFYHLINLAGQIDVEVHPDLISGGFLADSVFAVPELFRQQIHLLAESQQVFEREQIESVELLDFMLVLRFPEKVREFLVFKTAAV